jgi:hypothetical protein
MGTWFALLDGPDKDLGHIRHFFPSSRLKFETIDERWGLSAPELEGCADRNEACAKAISLLDRINVALRLSVQNYTEFDLFGLAEKDGHRIAQRILFAGTGDYRIEGVSAEAKAAPLGRPQRTRQDRLLSLMARNEDIEKMARELSDHPVRWNALRNAYETIKGQMSPTGDKSDYKNLIALGWMTCDQSNSLFDTANFYSHGHPRDPIKSKEIGYSDARQLVDSIFWRMVDAKEPPP